MEPNSDWKCKILNEFITMSLQFHINTAIFPISDEFYRRRDLIAQEPCRTKLRLFVCVFDFCFLTDVPHWFFSLPFNDSELSCGQLIWRKGQNSRKNRNKSTVFLLNIFTSGLGVISQTNGSHCSKWRSYKEPISQNEE